MLKINCKKQKFLLKASIAPLTFLITCILPVAGLFAQETRIELGPARIGLNQFFIITVISDKGQIVEFSKFPDIQGFTKAGRSASTTTTSVEGGQISVSQRMVQNYRPSSEGNFRLRPFSMRINGKSVDSKGVVITVGPAVEIPAQPAPGEEQNPEEVLEDQAQQPQNLPDPKQATQGAFLDLTTSKKSVFTGEGVYITLYFYLPFHDRNLLEFRNFGKQLPDIVEKIRQPNVWEEYFDQYEIEPENLELDGKPFLRFKLYEAVYFPLTAKPLLFPKVSLQMIRFRMLPHRSLDGPARVEESATFTTSPLRVEVKELPPHPLREQVAVGYFRLKEGLSQTTFKTRRGFHYLFQIEGTGNISTLTAPKVTWPAGLKVYEPAVKQYLRRGNARVTGSKGFDFFITPEEPGTYHFSEFAYWVYFNPASAAYDTLKPDLSITVTGPSSRNAAIAAAPQDSYYQNIAKADNKLRKLENFDQIRLYANIVLGLLLIVVVFIYFKK